MKTSIIVLISLLITACGLSPEQLATTAIAEQAQTQKAMPTITLSLTPRPNLTETKKANQVATQAQRAAKTQAAQTKIAKPTLTAVAEGAMTLDKIINASVDLKSFDISEAKLVYGPRDNILVHELKNTVIVHDPRLSLRNFIVSIKFMNPYDTSGTGTWDYGILFRNQYGNNQFRLIVLSNQSWTLYNAETKAYIYTSNDDNLRAKAGEENTIWLIVIDTEAYLFINGTFTKVLNVSSSLEAGDISPATGLYYGNLTVKRITEYQDFMVWSLP